GSDDKAVVDGDFVMLEQELQKVLKALRGAGINIVAIHQHMTGEQPRVLFLHFWGIGRTADLAKGIKAALDTQHTYRWARACGSSPARRGGTRAGAQLLAAERKGT